MVGWHINVLNPFGRTTPFRFKFGTLSYNGYCFLGRHMDVVLSYGDIILFYFGKVIEELPANPSTERGLQICIGFF